jgi:very-short-patch-repair endonuclease
MPRRKSTTIIQYRAGELRKEPTEAEAKLWSRLRTIETKGTHFRRQHAIGPYIVDFCTVRPKLVIEVDGSQHLEQEEYDCERTEFLESRGYLVLRFWNNEVLSDVDMVVGVILEKLEERVK